MKINRRHFLAISSLSALQGCTQNNGGIKNQATQSHIDYRKHAIAAANFIESQKVETEAGHTWYKSPDERVFELDLYHGAAGVVLFQIEMYRMTSDEIFLHNARLGIADILSKIPKEPKSWEHGLYTGTAACGFVLSEMFLATGEQEYFDQLVQIVNNIENELNANSADISFFSISDIVYGHAGIVLFLLDMAEKHKKDEWIQIAVRAGNELLQLAEDTPQGKRWLMMPEDTDEMPNFSHGTAGVAFALSKLFQASQELRFLSAAIAGANHLLFIANKDNGQCLVPHKLPGSSGRYYLAYCHGPVGTSRLFYQLAQVDNSQPWSDHFYQCNKALINSEIPKYQTPGFWDNVGQCCGSAAVAEHYISMYRISQDETYLNQAHLVAEDIIGRATTYENGQQWIHAENRTEPYWKQSYTGYMQGAAGIGSLFVRMAAIDNNKNWKSRLPDNPFPV